MKPGPHHLPTFSHDLSFTQNKASLQTTRKRPYTAEPHHLCKLTPLHLFSAQLFHTLELARCAPALHASPLPRVCLTCVSVAFSLHISKDTLTQALLGRACCFDAVILKFYSFLLFRVFLTHRYFLHRWACLLGVP